MKFKCKRAMVLLVTAAMLFGSIAVQAGCKESSSNKLTIWINAKDSYIGPSEQKLAQDQWYISQAIKRFEDENPGKTVELVVQADGETAHQSFKADAMAGTAPDLANLWTGQNIFSMEDVLLDITKYIPADDKKNISGWASVTAPSGSILGYPTSDNQICYFLFNRKIITECGLDFDKNPPRTIEDFNAACEKITKKGYQAIASDESFPWFYCYVGAYWWVQQSGMDRIISNCEGTTLFSEDEGLLSSLDYYKSTLTKGYLNQDAVTSADSWNKFCQGEVAMMPQVSSVIADAEDALGAENVGAILPPDFSSDAQIKDKTIGGPGQCLVVSKGSKNPELAVKFLSFLNSKEEVLEFMTFQPKIPTRTDITADELGYAAGSTSATLFQWANSTVYWIDNSLYSNVVGDFYNLLPTILSGEMTSIEFAQDLDARAKE